MQNAPQQILEKVFGYEQFHPLQREVIEHTLARRDSLVVMPTGSGKSLCYQIPALIFSGLTVVVSPLIALMKDQVEQLQALGVPALFLNSSLSWEEYRENVAQVRSGKVKLLYVAPETLLTERLLDLLSSALFECLIIDEAHCISEWGHDFRPEYRQIVEVRKRFPHVVCTALTATATLRVREDILTTLKISAANEFIASFNRENLYLEVVPKTDPLQQTLQFLSRFKDQAGIIYCFSRKQVDDLTVALQRRKISALPYHAGLEDGVRKANQDAFVRDEADMIVATIAFGMGINKPNVRFVIHFDLPKSIESYYQEIGRAGRDGLPAYCILFYSYGDLQKLKYFIDQKTGIERTVAYQHLSALTRYAESETCRRIPLLKYFGEDYDAENCAMCDNCNGGKREAVDLTIYVQKFLSCVVRTKEIFGAVHITDILLGEENEKVRKHGHQALSTFGIGKDLTRSQWMHLSRQLVQKGLLEQDDRYGSLRLTDRGQEVLKTRETVSGVLRQEKEPPKAGKRGEEIAYDHNLFDLLRKKRKELADQAHVPPYVVFSDRTLVEIAAYFPQSRQSLMRIHGVGTVKMEHYGDIFLDLITRYCEQNQIEEQEKERRVESKVTRNELRKPRYLEVGEAYNQGKTIPRLCEQYNVQLSTILEHLTRYALDGISLRDGNDLPAVSATRPEQVEAALKAFQTEGIQWLKPVFDRLNGEVSYEDLRILRLRFLMKKDGTR